MGSIFKPCSHFRTEDNFTPPSFPPRAIPQAVNSPSDFADYSRVEITPGMFHASYIFWVNISTILDD